ncbi:unnamed protein product [Sympodiomycopsis kandeliae]
MPLPASAWAQQVGGAVPLSAAGQVSQDVANTPQRRATQVRDNEDSGDEDDDDDLLPATQLAHTHVTASTFKSMSHWTNGLQTSAKSQTPSAPPLKSMHIPSLTQSQAPRSTQTLTANARHFDLFDDNDCQKESNSAVSASVLRPVQDAIPSTLSPSTLTASPRPSSPATITLPALAPVMEPMSVTPAYTGSNTLDRLLSSAAGDDILGIPSEGAIELVGPTASGKTQWALQMALRARIAALKQRIQEEGHQHNNNRDQDGNRDPKDNRDQAVLSQDMDRDQVLIIDTEGSIKAPMIRDIASRLLFSAQEGSIPLPLDGVLRGVTLLPATTPSTLISILRILTSKYQLDMSSSTLPPAHTLSTIILDSISYHTRSPIDYNGSSSSEDQSMIKRQITTLLTQLLSTKSQQRVIMTNQMALKMFHSQNGQLVNYRVPNSIAKLVPQFQFDNRYTDVEVQRVLLFRGVEKYDFGKRYAAYYAQQEQIGFGCIPIEFDQNGIITERGLIDTHYSV